MFEEPTIFCKDCKSIIMPDGGIPWQCRKGRYVNALNGAVSFTDCAVMRDALNQRCGVEAKMFEAKEQG